MAAVTRPRSLVIDARELARALLTDLPERWRHSAGVARRAEQVAGTLPNAADRKTLIAAAWLHDIGYATRLHVTGFHPLDGGLYLLGVEWPKRVASLVAHHSEAFCVAEVRGLADRLSEFPAENSPVTDALTYADQTVGPNGREMRFDQRLADMLHRHGPMSPNALAHPRRAPRLRAAVSRVEHRLLRLPRSNARSRLPEAVPAREQPAHAYRRTARSLGRSAQDASLLGAQTRPGLPSTGTPFRWS